MTIKATRYATDVIVVGAGPVGTLLAAEIVLGGGSVIVLERDREIPDTIKAGSINLASAELLARRGLIDEARAIHRDTLAAISPAGGTVGGSGPAAASARPAPAIMPRAAHFAGIMLDPGRIDPADPDVVAHSDALDGTFIAQRELQQLLDAHAQRLGVPVRRGATVTGLTVGDDVVVVRTEDDELRARWVVGADGGRSLVRHLAGFDFAGTEPEITGRQAVVEFAQGDAEAIPVGWRWTPRGVYRHGPRPGVVLTVEFDGPPADRDAPVTVAEVQSSLRRVTGTQVTVTGLRGRATRWTDNARQATSYRRGRVLLAGDAAHVHSPFSGQGLNLGLGDATNLGWKLAAAITGRGSDELVDSYDTERRPIGAWVLDWTRAQVALMRPDVKTGQLRDVVTDLLGTRDGLTRVVNEISGVLQWVDLPGSHPLIGRLVPDLATADGASLRERFASGQFVLLDRSADGAAAELAADWGDRIVVIREPGVEGQASPAALLARPDGVVAWAADSGEPDLGALGEALRGWAGSPERVSTGSVAA